MLVFEPLDRGNEIGGVRPETGASEFAVADAEPREVETHHADTRIGKR